MHVRYYSQHASERPRRVRSGRASCGPFPLPFQPLHRRPQLILQSACFDDDPYNADGGGTGCPPGCSNKAAAQEIYMVVYLNALSWKAPIILTYIGIIIAHLNALQQNQIRLGANPIMVDAILRFPRPSADPAV